MKLTIGRRLFVLLIALHPATFRADFAQEMLHTYDEAVEEFGTVWLLWDGCISLLRQLTAVRSDNPDVLSDWKAVGLRSGIYPLVASSRLTAGQLISATLLSAVLYELIRPG